MFDKTHHFPLSPQEGLALLLGELYFSGGGMESIFTRDTFFVNSKNQIVKIIFFT
jgi:hypothetical protein